MCAFGDAFLFMCALLAAKLGGIFLTAPRSSSSCTSAGAGTGARASASSASAVSTNVGGACGGVVLLLGPSIVGIDQTVGMDAVAVASQEASAEVVGNKAVYNVDLPYDQRQGPNRQQSAHHDAVIMQRIIGTASIKGNVFHSMGGLVERGAGIADLHGNVFSTE